MEAATGRPTLESVLAKSTMKEPTVFVEIQTAIPKLNLLVLPPPLRGDRVQTLNYLFKFYQTFFHVQSYQLPVSCCSLFKVDILV